MSAPFLRRLSIRGKLLLMTMLSSSVALLLASVLYTFYQWVQCRNELIHDAAVLSQLIARNSLPAVLLQDRQAAAETLATLETHLQVHAAAVFSGDGQVLGRYVRAGETHSLPSRWEMATAQYLVGDYLEVYEPVVSQQDPVGGVYLKMDLGDLYEHLVDQSLVGALVLLGSFLAAFLISVRMQREIAGPIQGLANAVRQLERPGGVRARGGDDTADELLLLRRSFAALVEDLQIRDAALQRSERYFRSLIENASDMIALVDRSGAFLYKSPSVQQILGYEPDELIGHNVLDLMHPDDLERVRDALQGSLSTPGSTIDTELRLRHHDGTWRVLEVRGRNLLADPVVAGIVLNSRDVTQRRETERALHESREWFRHLVEHAADAFFLHDFQGRILDVNQRACDSLGYTREELLALTVPDIEMDFAGGGQGVWDTMRPGVPVTVQGTQRRRDGSAFPVEVRVGLFESSRGALLVALARDMTERERAAAELNQAKEDAEAAARAKAQFLANMSHEIRTPMNAVIGMADLLQHTPLSSDQQHYVEIIRNSGDALLSVIDDILDLSKLEAGKFVAQAADFDLQSLVEEVLDMLAHRAQGKGVELACLVDEGVATSLRGDAGCLRQVLLNLLGNAIKFTDHGEVHARVRLLEETPAEVRLEVEVRDSGIGIPEDLRPRLFDAFVQGDMSSKRRYGGAGLGLAISRSLVEMMGGTIRVESQMGQGSAFFFDCRFERQAAAQERLPDMEPARGVRSLVVGDNAVVREYLCADLRRWGMRADAAAGAGQALGLLGAAGDDPYRIALVDVRMAEVDGLTLVRRARLDPALVATRFVLLRPLTEPLDPSLLAAAGADAQISKPVRLAWLAETLLGLLAASPARAAPVPAVAAAPRRPARVLVAEDNPINQEVALLILRKLGYRVDAVGSGRAALQALADRRYDIVFMDGQMPEMDGYEAAAEIRRREGAARRTPIVAMTAHALEGDRERCLDAGMDDCLFKPVTEGKLIEALQRWLPAASAPETVLDPEVWEALARVQAGGTAEFIPRLIDLFLDDATQRLASLRAAHAAGDRVRIAREAHALKGGARQMGAADLARACGDLQAGADRAGADTDLGGLIAEVEEACWTVEQALHAQRAAWAAPGPGAGAA